jgi:hypothetical protein
MKGTWERNDFMSGPLLITYTWRRKR